MGQKPPFKPGLRLDTQIQFLKGVGPKLGDVLAKKDIRNVQDLLENYPRAYEDRRAARNIASLKPNELVSLKAQIQNVSSYSMGKSHRKIYDVTLYDGSGKIHCKYFRVPYRGYFERFKVGQEVRVVGKVTFYRSMMEFHHPDLEEIKPEEDETKDQVLPIYPETEGLSTRQIQKMLSQVIREFDKDVPPEIERLPKWIEEKYNLVRRWTALKNIHIPPQNAGADFVELKSESHRRIIFEEFFWLELYLASKRSSFKDLSAESLRSDFELVTRLVQSLSFKLTTAQRRAFKEIADDLAKNSPMHRLVQGDVGSGKTLVAFMSALIAIQNKKQVALMVPTEILAGQHFINSQKYLEPLGVRAGLLTGSMKAAEKQKVYDRLAKGEIDICVGTHALIQENVEFKDLALAIIDEQHRFGVEQRSMLKSKGQSKDKSPHFLIMTATPIPRTLAMTVYGDLDVSVIDELPPGRTPIVTRVAYDSARPKFMTFLKEQILAGRQAYIVYPLVEESEKIDLKDAISQFERLKVDFPDFKIALLHGKMKPQEKDDIMIAFRKGEYQILVSTTVIEVGVDVANATLMVIEHAERFGLSQLHQLRGRVGRGSLKSYCILFMGKAVSIESRERVKIMETTSDGFKISEADLEIRGPGEFLGRRQSGLPGFKLANLIRDVKILSEAREAAFSLLEKDPKLNQSEHQALKSELTKSGGSLASVG